MTAHFSCNPVRSLCHGAAALMALRLGFVPPMPKDDDEDCRGLRQRRTQWPAHCLDLLEDAAHLALLIGIMGVGLGVYLFC